MESLGHVKRVKSDTNFLTV